MSESKEAIILDSEPGSRGTSSPQTGTLRAEHAEHGAPIDHKVFPQEEILNARDNDLAWSRIRHQYRDYLSEFFGTFILLLFGDGVVAQVVLSRGEKGDYQSISWGWGSVLSHY